MDTDLHKIITSSQYLSVDHIKLFLYQLLRGLKYLHSAGIIHRDLKPGNLLVNTNCLLKICDFGLARSAPRLDPDEPSDSLTMEVVTQFYRSPELLLGSCFYTSAIDLWSVGCILAELLTRRILFQSMSPFRQLDMIFDLLGSPTPMDLVDLVGCPSLSIEFLLSRPVRPANHAALVNLVRLVPRPPFLSSSSPFDQPTDPDLLALLLSLLKFSPSKRVTAEDALKSPFVAAGRARFHSSTCSCCPHTLCPPGPPAVTFAASTTARPFVSTAAGPIWMDLLPLCGGPVRPGALNSANTLSSSSPCTPPSPFTASHLVGLAELMLGVHQFGLRSTGFSNQSLTIPPPLLIPPPQIDLEPIYSDIDETGILNTEVRMESLDEAKRMLWNLIEYYFQRDPHRARVVINNSSPSFGSFIASSVAHG
ncbi:Mitogen-activated protein kinase [Fasciolopsis buskii]|uniref:Mitogen-activated protein kinase n=1 Tax=Fasciolopsis buskii TaxID=27845 RepID=A0A8E0RUN7_9TREM|nr:Mitogen-activated protein kinase [Fasciolopsis buski]